MEFDLHIDKQLLGKMVVTDYSNDYGQYIAEDSDITELTEEPFKYSETYSLNAIIRITVDDATLIDVLMNEHKYLDELLVFEPDQFEFVAETDGYYTITHFIVPNEKWMENTFNVVKDNYVLNHFDENGNLYKSGVIYFMKSDGTFWKRIYSNNTQNWLDPVSALLTEILETDMTAQSPLTSCKIDTFYTGYLQECYINICKDLFDQYLKGCRPNCLPKYIDTYPRDFLWMTLNIIDYLIGFGEYLEAQRILEQISYCGGFCDNVKDAKNTGCGCNPKPRSCGCR